MQTKTNKTGCSFVRRNLFSYQEKQLTGKELNEFEAHLRSCDDCSRIISDFQFVTSIIDEKKSVEPNPFSATHILQRIEAHMEGERHSANPFLQRILRPISVSFLMLIAVVIGFSIVKLNDSKLSGTLKHQNDIQAMKSGLNIPDFIDENNTFFDNE
jgi:hypothetical protein